MVRLQVAYVGVVGGGVVVRRQTLRCKAGRLLLLLQFTILLTQL